MTNAATSLAIRADGDARLGFGHVMRCTALVQALLADGHQIAWFTRTPQAVPAKLAARIKIAPLADDDNLLPALAGLGFTALIGDWQITEAKLCQQLRHAGVWLALVGNHPGEAIADLQIRQEFGPQPNGPRPDVCGGAAHILLASRYASLPSRSAAQPVRRLLISLGGSTTSHLDAVHQMIDGLPALRGVDIRVIRPGPPGTPVPEAGLLEELLAADLAILAAGTTLHEAAATGLPALALPIAANQRPRARQYQELGLGLSLDPAADGFAPALQATLGRLLGDPQMRQAFSRAGQLAVDGLGAARVAERIADARARSVKAFHTGPQAGKAGRAS